MRTLPLWTLALQSNALRPQSCLPRHSSTTRTPLPHMKATATAAVRVTTEEWPGAEACRQGFRSVYLYAHAFDARGREVEIGECGLEILPVDPLGLTGGDDPSVRPRALLTGTLYVKPTYRRQGVAQRLLREAESMARLWGLHELMLPVDQQNANAIRLYEKMGYRRTKQTVHHGSKLTMRYRSAPRLS